MDLDFSLRGVFTTWAVHVLGKNRDLGEEIIGKDPYLLGSVVTCEWMWPLRAEPALYEQLELLIWTWQESKEARGPDNYNRDLTRLRPNTRTSSIYNCSLTGPKQIRAQTFPETNHWLHWHRWKLDFLANLTSGNLFRLFKSEIMITNVRLVVSFKTSFLLLVNCLQVDFWLVTGCTSYWSQASVLILRAESMYPRSRQLCQKCQFSNNSYFYSRPVLVLSGLFEQKFIHLCEVTC